MKKLKPGDVVIIEWKDIWPHIIEMGKLDGHIGVVKSIFSRGNIEVKHMEEEIIIYNGLDLNTWNWHPTSLTKIGTL